MVLNPAGVGVHWFIDYIQFVTRFQDSAEFVIGFAVEITGKHQKP
jgi:hypothetical protein